MKQTTFASLAYSQKKKQTHREMFLTEMDQVVPWDDICALIEPHYPKPTKTRGGRIPLPLIIELGIYCLQQFYDLSDPRAEEALYDLESMRLLTGIEQGEDAVPDESTIWQFRRPLERHSFTAALFETINRYLTDRSLLHPQGTLVDATIIHAPSSTKNKQGKRDPEMSQTRKGNQWYFGMKAHIGVDDASGLVHMVIGTAAKVADITQLDNLLHEEKQVVLGDAGYQHKKNRTLDSPELESRPYIVTPYRNTKHRTRTDEDRELNRELARLRAKVEHPFQVLKRQFGFTKVRYRGLTKNTARLHALFTLSSLWMVRRYLLATAG